MRDEIEKAYNEAYQQAIKVCHSVSDIHVDIVETMIEMGYEPIDGRMANVPSNYTRAI